MTSITRKPAKQAWTKGLQASVKVGRKGWGVSEARGKVRLKVRLPHYRDSEVLPIEWNHRQQADVLQLIGRVYQELHPNYDKSLASVIKKVLGSSDKHFEKVVLPWEEIIAELKQFLMEHKNKITEKTYQTNYGIYFHEALNLLNADNHPENGADLLRQLLELKRYSKKPGKNFGQLLKRWADLDNSRAYCCSAIKLLMEHAVEEGCKPAAWKLTNVQYNNLRGASSVQSEKAALDDDEILDLITAIETRNPRWANVLRLLAAYGLRGEEIGHLAALKNPQGEWQLKCTKGKVSASRGRKKQNPPRWLVPLPLIDRAGSCVKWDLVEQIAYGQLQLPVNRNGEQVKINGASIGKFIRNQPEWQTMVQIKAAQGEHLKPYAFRDSYSVRGHAYGISDQHLSPAMGHSVAVHNRSYLRSTYKTMMDAFSRAASANDS